MGFLTGDVPEEVRPYIRRVRVFLGHAGWGPDQLEAELEEESWIVEEEPRADDVFTPLPEALWGEILRRKGPPYSTLARVPFDPKTN